MAQSKSGQDPTRNHPGGSRTETKIAEQSELGSDNAADTPSTGEDHGKGAADRREQTRSDKVR